MERILPSERLRKELKEMVNNAQESTFSMSDLVRRAAGLIAQELLEQEVTDFLGRGHYERTDKEDAKKGHRNGYEPLTVRTGEGTIGVSRPQVRDTEEPYRSRLAAFFKGNTEVLEKLAVEMYARGLSTRDVEDALMEATGDMVLSKSAVSKVTDILWKEFEGFQQRDLSAFTVEYLFCDAVYESLRAHFGMKDAVLCAWGITREGQKILLHLALGNKESYKDWLEFLRNMAKRGLRIPTSITTDGAPGLIKAVESAFSKSLRLRCWFHRMENFNAKVPEETWPEVKAQLVMIRDAASYEQGKQCAQEFIATYRNRYPSLITAFTDDLDALLNHLKLPINHRRRVRTSNLVERAFEETRRRTKIIPRFLTEKSGLKLVYSVLARAAQRWRRIPVTAFDLLSLDRLREALGIEEEAVENQRELREVRQ